ncbi:unnamed protein product [Clonostachys rosea]|uniref:NACHT domain-containing protein n=1 Tax=Bionectria ochroleuca TaxID=29856 RepID=A0ABY6TQM2_BIOOC|nr:unnamed protein product [Clonostachys rosea]
MADPLSITGSAVGIVSLGLTVAQGLIQYYQAYQGQSEHVAHTSKKLKHLLDLLESLKALLDNEKSHARDGELLTKVNSCVQDSGESIQELEEQLAKVSKTSDDDAIESLYNAGRRLVYPFRKSTLRKLEEDIDDSVECLSFALQLLQQETLDQLQDDLGALLDLARAADTPASISMRLPKKKHPGTGNWFAKGSQYKDWLETPASFLWVAGFAGCGKSVLMTTIIQHTYRHRRSNPDIGLAFFFFTFNDETKQSCSAMLRSIILQLSSQLNQKEDALSQLWKRYKPHFPPDQALLECFRQLVRSFKKDVYIIIDALDESPFDKHREGVLEALDEVRSWSEARLHLTVSSRDYFDIRSTLLSTSSDESVIKMKNESIDRDIKDFVHQHLRTHQKFRKWSDHYDQIEVALTDGAQGVFRWVECQFTALTRCPASVYNLKRTLKSLPRSLDETYARMLRDVDAIYREDMDYSTKWSTMIRAQIDGVIQRGDQNTLSTTIRSYLDTITYQYLFHSQPEDYFNKFLQDTWYALIQAGKHITTHEFHQDIVVRELVIIRALGLLQRSVLTEDDSDTDSCKKPGDLQGIITFSDGHTLWSGLPLLSICLADEFTERYYQKDYSAKQRENMAGLLARLLAVGFYDGPALCALSLFRETLETSRPLVADADSQEVLPVEDLLEALTDLCQNSGFGLAILSSSRTPEATISTLKTNSADYLHLSGLGELALQAGTITDSSPTGYSLQRWSFWVQRLTELSQCGINSIERQAKFCLTPMCWAVQELMTAIAVELGDSPRYNAERQLKSTEDIQQICAGLVEFEARIVGEDHEGIRELRTILAIGTRYETVRIAHFSVQEFLMSNWIQESKDLQDMASFYVNMPDANDQMVCTCLTLLMEPSILDTSKSTSHTVLEYYAARYWVDHLDKNNSSSPTTKQAIHMFWGEKFVFRQWKSMWNRYGDFFIPSNPSLKSEVAPLYLASLLGLTSIKS